MELLDALTNAAIFGVSLAAFITTLVQFIKGWLGLEGSPVKLLALGLGTLLGSLYLIFVFIPAPVDAFDYVFRVAASFVWSFLSPGFYELLKQTSRVGAVEVAEEVVLPAVEAQTEEITEVVEAQ